MTATPEALQWFCNLELGFCPTGDEAEKILAFVRNDGVSDGAPAPQETSLIRENTHKNPGKRMETFQEGYAAGVEAAAAVAIAWDGWERDGDRRCADEIRRLVAFTPCDRPYPDCTVCKGTGKHDGDPCAVCVWKRWAEDARAAGALKTPEELEAERVEGRDIKPENVTRALNILSGAVDGYDYSDDKDYQGHAELLRNAAEAAYQALLGTRVETPETSK